MEKLFAQYNAYASQVNENIKAAPKPAKGHAREELKFLDDKTLDHVCRLLQNGGELQGLLLNTLGNIRYLSGKAAAEWNSFAEHLDCELIHVIRLFAMAGGIGQQRRIGFIDWNSTDVSSVTAAATNPRFRSCISQRRFAPVGLPDEALGKSYS